MAFRTRWRELTKLGWKASKPTGLSNSYTYVVPGRKKRDGVRGHDYFVGEEELMKYLDSIDLVELRTQNRDETAPAKTSDEQTSTTTDDITCKRRPGSPCRDRDNSTAGRGGSGAEADSA
ncbi:hypothetical protein PR003_g2468 [Phytophthora rubi]|uniref:Uncharacterized protein n=1 Tax=Phytophthora rubi TaxID=129364 RepID=A0A6A3NHV4_9STRA|nr:hypothetical protein PR002_g2469 [Phytophthora rubi]KAE9050364.1 hypothetical protein PR001_g2447 [Phytophthora rubi]KAE9356181.1 hypothetical protein PR003_g2468 [Phytophthora rubi]